LRSNHFRDTQFSHAQYFFLEKHVEMSILKLNTPIAFSTFARFFLIVV